jgi:hypothetical protein
MVERKLRDLGDVDHNIHKYICSQFVSDVVLLTTKSQIGCILTKNPAGLKPRVGSIPTSGTIHVSLSLRFYFLIKGHTNLRKARYASPAHCFPVSYSQNLMIDD